MNSLVLMAPLVMLVYLHRVEPVVSPTTAWSAASITYYSGQLNPALLSNFPSQRNFNLGGCCNRYLKTLLWRLPRTTTWVGWSQSGDLIFNQFQSTLHWPLRAKIHCGLRGSDININTKHSVLLKQSNKSLCSERGGGPTSGRDKETFSIKLQLLVVRNI